MLRFDSFMHRDALAEIISRWMVNRPQPGDVQQLKEVVNFNLYAARLWLDHLSRKLLIGLHQQTPRWCVARTKGEFKDFAVRHLSYTSPRIEQMCAHYERFPEDYYRDTPIDGGYYTIEAQGEELLAATNRIKRFRRIAEKGARRIVDYMFTRIRSSADQLAEQRARDLGIPRGLLATPPEIMAEEFAHAERRVIKGIKKGTIAGELPVFGIPDVAGIKLILESAEQTRLMELLDHDPDCSVTEYEVHRGQYNAVNLRLDYRVPMDLLRDRPPLGPFVHLLQLRGLNPHKVAAAYLDFLDQAEPVVGLEIIVTNFQEYLESEIGRGMHEERVLSQRRHPEYSGHLAANIRYLLEYILGICRAPGLKDVDEVPVKLWVKYMPDTIEQLIRGLYMDDSYFFDTVPEELR